MIDAALLDMNSGKNKTMSSVFWALDPRLPHTAARAAVEFDWLIQAKRGALAASRSRESIGLLDEILSGSIGRVQNGAEKEKTFVDSGGLTLFAKAYNEANRDRPVAADAELLSAIAKVTGALQKAHQNAQIDENELTQMRDFCVALSDHAAAYRESVYGQRQEHPYRKARLL